MAFTASDWGRGVLLTGLTPSTTLSGYVALISLDNVPVESIDAGANSAINGGGDLRFSTDIDGINQLPLDVVSFVTNASSPSRSCQLWIRFPTYASGTREVYMFYKKAAETQPAVGAAFGRNAVFQDEINRMHMESATPVDSTGNQTSIVANAVSVVTGNIGNALDFNGSTSDIDLGAAILPMGDFTQSIWVNPDALGGFQGFIGNFQSPNIGRTYLGANGSLVNWDGYDTSGNTRGSLVNGSWARVSVTRTGSTVTVYIDAIQQGSTIADAGVPDTTVNTFIGALSQGTSNFFDGQIGDNLLSNNYSSVDKLLSEQANQSDPSTFWTTGSPFTPVGGGVTVTAERQDYSLTFYDATVDLTGQVLVNAESQLYQVQFFDGQVDLIAGIDVLAQTQDYDITFFDATVQLSGVINVSADNQLYSVTFYDAFVSITELWTDKPKAVTNWGDKSDVVTIWTDK